LIDISEARYGAVPDDVHAVIEDTHDDAVLHAWVKLAATRSRDEIIAAIRAVRRADSVYATRDRQGESPFGDQHRGGRQRLRDEQGD
jgi:hypothetical protein